MNKHAIFNLDKHLYINPGMIVQFLPLIIYQQRTIDDQNQSSRLKKIMRDISFKNNWKNGNCRGEIKEKVHIREPDSGQCERR